MRHRCLSVLAFFCLLALVVPASAEPAKGKKYALLIGVTKYDHASLPTLQYTENDVEELAEILGKPAAGFTVQRMTVSRGEKNAKAMPNKANIDKALGDLFDKAKKDDVVLIALAGHGVNLEVPDPDGDKPSKTYTYFCPSDASFRKPSYSTGKHPRLILLPELLKDLGGCGAGTKLIMVDACRNELKADSATRNFDAGDLSLPRGMGAMFSCKPGERAWETKKLGKKGHGVFFHYVIEGLKKEAANKKGQVTWASLSEYVSTSVSEQVPRVIGKGASQTPHGAQNFFGGSPVLLEPGEDNPKATEKPLPTSGARYTFKPIVFKDGHGVQAVDGQNKQMWYVNSTKVDSGAKGPPRAIGVLGERVYSYQGSRLFCFEAKDGKTLWITNLSIDASANVILSRESDEVLRVSDGKTVHRFDARTGKLLKD